MKYSTEILKAEIDENGFAKNLGWIKTYVCDKDAPHEYIGATMELLYKGVTVGEWSFTDAPAIPDNKDMAIIRSEDKTHWQYIPDHRGKTVFDTTNQTVYTVDCLGDIKPGFTLLMPETIFDKWNGRKWVTDKHAMKAAQINQAYQTKFHRIDEAESTIVFLERKNRLGLISSGEKALLRAWETYSVRLHEVDINQAPDIIWPPEPG